MDILLLVAAGLFVLALVGHLLIQMARMRLELWANQRVIAALKQAGHKPAAKKSHLPELLAAALLLLLLFQILLLFLIPA